MKHTIAAICTGLTGSVGIIRVSGPLAVDIAQKICHPFPNKLDSHRLYLGRLVELTPTELPASNTQAFYPEVNRREDEHFEHPFVKSSGAPQEETGSIIDQVMYCLMLAPKSYTGEDILEIHAHGGAINLNRVLQAVLKVGAQLAQPGEFTKRAFLNKKMDLTQAEAISSLIGAQSTLAVKQAQKQLSGELGSTIRSFQHALLKLLGKIEGALDFPDLKEDSLLLSEVLEKIAPIQKTCSHLAQSFDQGGKFLVSGVDIALLGKTNAGKSSLLNTLCGMERVLVDAQPGTTRDYVEVSVEWDNIKITLIDTAGLHSSQTLLEKQGSFLAQRRWRNAALILLIVDSSSELSKEEESILEQSKQENIPVLLVWNKIDLIRGKKHPSIDGIPQVFCSALNGTGIKQLKEKILSMVVPGIEEEQIILNARQARLMKLINENLSDAKQLATLKTLDLLASVLRDCLMNLNQIRGDNASYDVLDEVFSQFCIGK